SNSQTSYLPSRRVLAEPSHREPFPFSGNYEGATAFMWYGWRAPVTADAGDRFVAAHASLLDGFL
ncbi:MAG TPA: hypothetical protein VKT77_02780, partial [Chthonomonadaceae bacterium]|nr:hypothetical protein [Chthonomonadaceae bacterium]